MDTSAEEWNELVKQPSIQKIMQTQIAVMDKYIRDLISGDDMILDLACGNGVSTNYVSEKYGCHAVGIDIMEGMIAGAKEKYGGLRTEFFKGDMCDPLLVQEKKGLFKWVMCHQGLQYCYDLDAFLTNVNHSLADDGYLLLHFTTREFGDPGHVAAFLGTIKLEKWQKYRAEMEASMTAPFYKSSLPDDHFLMSHDALLTSLKRYGFEVRAKEVCYGVFTFPLTAVFFKATNGAVKVLPNALQEEFVQDMLSSGQRLCGGKDPEATIHNVVIVAQKTG